MARGRDWDKLRHDRLLQGLVRKSDNPEQWATDFAEYDIRGEVWTRDEPDRDFVCRACFLSYSLAHCGDRTNLICGDCSPGESESSRQRSRNDCPQP